VALTEACGGGLEVRSDEEGAALALALVGEEAVVTLAAATAVAREELGGEAEGMGRDVAGGEGVAPGAVVWRGADGVREVAFGGVAPGECLLELWLLQGGVALCWVGVPASVSTSIGEASVGGGAATAAAYEPGAEV